MKIKGNGTVRQVKNKNGKPVKNSWQLVLSLGNDPLTGKRRQATRSFRGTKTEARRALETFRREIEWGLRIDADEVVFGDYSSQWLEARKISGRFAAATTERNEQLLSHLNRHLGNTPLSDIDATVVRNLYAMLANEGVGIPTISKVAVTLHQILEQAVDDDIILRNPCDRVKAPKQQKSRIGKALSKKEAQRLMSVLDKEGSIEYPNAKFPQQKRTENRAHVMAAKLAIAAGLRQGEVLGLSWEDINFESGELNVRHTLCKVTHELKNPKTESGNRTILLDARTLDALKQWQSEQSRYLMSLGIRRSGSTAVITSAAGTRMDGNNLGRWWRRIRSKYGFDGLRFHDLRHTHATILASGGLNIKALSARIGHASVKTTMDLYAHALREDDEKAAEIIGDSLVDSSVPVGSIVTFSAPGFQSDCDSSVIVDVA